MPITVKCPSCSTPMSAPDQMAGQMVRCPKCSATLQVPAASASPNSAPPGAAPGKAPGPEPAAKSRKGLYIGAGVGAVLLLLSCCVVSIAGYFVYSSLTVEKNEKVTKENFDKLKTGMTLNEIEEVLGPGKPTTLDDVKAAYKGEPAKQLNKFNAEHAVAIEREADYRWRNGDEFVFAILSGPAKDSKAVLLSYVKGSVQKEVGLAPK